MAFYLPSPLFAPAWAEPPRMSPVCHPSWMGVDVYDMEAALYQRAAVEQRLLEERARALQLRRLRQLREQRAREQQMESLLQLYALDALTSAVQNEARQRRHAARARPTSPPMVHHIVFRVPSEDPEATNDAEAANDTKTTHDIEAANNTKTASDTEAPNNTKTTNDTKAVNDTEACACPSGSCGASCACDQLASLVKEASDIIAPAPKEAVEKKPADVPNSSEAADASSPEAAEASSTEAAAASVEPDVHEPASPVAPAEEERAAPASPLTFAVDDQTRHQDEAAAAPQPRLLFSHDFPAATSPYGQQVRKAVQASAISVEANPADGGRLVISGLWSATPPPASRSNSRRSAHVRDVDEDGNEVLMPGDTDSDSDAEDPVAFDQSAVIPLPHLAKLHGLRPELDEDGFRVWLDQ